MDTLTSQQIGCSTEPNSKGSIIEQLQNENEFLLIRITGLEQVIQSLQEAIDRLEDELHDALHRSGCDSD